MPEIANITVMTQDHISEAAELFDLGYNCTQAVFSVYAQEYGLDPYLARKIATGLGGGISRTGNICGAVTGAILVLSLACGAGNYTETKNREKTYFLDNEFILRFTARFGSVQCPALLGYNMAVSSELAEARRIGVAKKVCPELIRGAIEILEELLDTEKA